MRNLLNGSKRYRIIQHYPHAIQCRTGGKKQFHPIELALTKCHPINGTAEILDYVYLMIRSDPVQSVRNMMGATPPVIHSNTKNTDEEEEGRKKRRRTRD